MKLITKVIEKKLPKLYSFEEIRGMFGLKVERDLYFWDGETLGEVLGCLII